MTDRMDLIKTAMVTGLSPNPGDIDWMISEIDRLAELNDASHLAYHLLLDSRDNLLTEIKNLRALCSSTGTGRPFFPG